MHDALRQELLQFAEQHDQRVIAEQMLLVAVGLLVHLDGEASTGAHLCKHVDVLAERVAIRSLH